MVLFNQIEFFTGNPETASSHSEGNVQNLGALYFKYFQKQPLKLV